MGRKHKTDDDQAEHELPEDMPTAKPAELSEEPGPDETVDLYDVPGAPVDYRCRKCGQTRRDRSHPATGPCPRCGFVARAK